MTTFQDIQSHLKENTSTWLVTGVAGFIGSHLAESLLSYNQTVIGLDNLSSGKQENLETFKDHPNFTFIEGDIRNFETCLKTTKAVDYVLHHAAIGSVTKSVEDPILVDQVNNGGCINILFASAQNQVRHVVYASSSAIYGDAGGNCTRQENDLPNPLSPYAAGKCANEYYAQALSNTHNIHTTGLRYFNIYGPRQDPNGAYAAVIPKWINQMLVGETIEIYGDGETVRDFCFIEDVVHANILAAITGKAKHAIYNIAAGEGTTLNDLFSDLKDGTAYNQKANYKDFRPADIKISRADISQIEKDLGFTPKTNLQDGLKMTIAFYKDQTDG